MKWVRLVGWLGMGGAFLCTITAVVCVFVGSDAASKLGTFSAIWTCEFAAVFLVAVLLRAIVFFHRNRGYPLHLALPGVATDSDPSPPTL